MARPSKKQLAERKAAAKAERRSQSYDALYEWINAQPLWDEVEIACEGCGQRQLSGNPACVVCGSTIGATIPGMSYRAPMRVDAYLSSRPATA